MPAQAGVHFVSSKNLDSDARAEPVEVFVGMTEFSFAFKLNGL